MLSNLTLDHTNAARLKATWQGDTAGMDGVELQLLWHDDASFFEWTVIAPPGTNELTLPELPPALASSAPTANADNETLDVYAFAADSIDGYADFRRHYAARTELMAGNADIPQLWMTTVRNSQP